MFKKISFFKCLAGLTAATVILSSSAFAANMQQTVTAVYNNIKIAVDGTRVIPKDVNGNVVSPFIIDGTTYLPVRALASALGQNVTWDSKTNTVNIGGEPEISIGENTLLQPSDDAYRTVEVTAVYKDIKIVVNGTEIIPKDVNGNIVEPFIIDGTTYLPVRALANALGEDVSWEQSTSTVYVGEQPFRLDASVLKQFADKTLITVGNTPLKGSCFNIYAVQSCNTPSFEIICDNYAKGSTLQNLTINQEPAAKFLCDYISEDFIPVVAVYDYAQKNSFLSKNGIQETLDAIFANYRKQFSTETEYKGFLAECGITAEDFENFVEINSVYTLFVDDLFSRYLSIPYSPEEFEQLYSSRYITAKHILVQDENTAEGIIKELNKGTSFDVLSDKYNLDPGATNSGYTFTKGEMVPEFETAAFALKENTYTHSPVKSSYGYHIIMRLPLDTDWITANQSTVLQSLASMDTYDTITKIVAETKTSVSDEYSKYISTIK